MLYHFRDKDTGEPAEFEYRMADAPPLDSEVRRDGRTWVRVVSPDVQVAGSGFRGSWATEIECPSLPPNATGKKSKRGFAVCENAKEAREVTAKMGLGWE